MKNNWNSDNIREMLAKQTLQITFTKKDGTERVMLCTRNFDALLENAAETGYSSPTSPTDAHKLPENLLRVWSIEDKGWRIVNLDTVSNVEEEA